MTLGHAYYEIVQGRKFGVSRDQKMKSDEDYARELQAMWDTEIAASGHPSIGLANTFQCQESR